MKLGTCNSSESEGLPSVGLGFHSLPHCVNTMYLFFLNIYILLSLFLWRTQVNTVCLKLLQKRSEEFLRNI